MTRVGSAGEYTRAWSMLVSSRRECGSRAAGFQTLAPIARSQTELALRAADGGPAALRAPIGRPARDATGGRAHLTLAITAAPLGWPRPRSGTLGPRSGTLGPARHARATLSLLSGREACRKGY